MHTRFTGLIGLFSSATSGQPTAPLSLLWATGATLPTSGSTPADRFADHSYDEVEASTPVAARTAATSQVKVGQPGLACA